MQIHVAAVVESEMHSLDFEGTIMLVSAVTRGNSEEVRSVIDTNKVVKRKLENVTPRCFQFTFRFASVSCSSDNNRRPKIWFCHLCETISHWKNDDLPSQQRSSPLFVQRIDKFPSYFSPFIFSTPLSIFFSNYLSERMI